jgi:hypothetical protein
MKKFLEKILAILVVKLKGSFLRLAPAYVDKKTVFFIQY